MQAGFIGLGTMGASMAANLQKGLKARGDTLVVHDIRREAAARHVKDGAVWVDSPQAVAEQSEVIFTSLPGPPEFEAVAAGLLAGIKKGTAYFDLTTNSPTVVRKAHDTFAAKGAYPPAYEAFQRRAIDPNGAEQPMLRLVDGQGTEVEVGRSIV